MTLGATLPINSHYLPVPESATPSYELRFPSEDALVRAAIAQSPHGKGTTALTGIIDELQTPDGIADLVFYRLRRDWKRYSIIGDIPSRWAFAFHRLPYRVLLETAFVADLCGVTERRARQALNNFVDLGLCRPARREAGWIKTRQLLPPAVELVAVEAKLRDWKKALFQAVRYLSFADRSWVLLDQTAAEPALKHQHMFSLRGIGLASLSRNGELQINVPALHADRARDHERWVVNSELMKRINPT